MADFGLSRDFQSVNRKYTTQVVTLWYRAPELLLDCEYDEQIDVWSLGCIVVEMLNNGQPLFKGQNELQMFKAFCQVLGYPNSQTWPEYMTKVKPV